LTKPKYRIGRHVWESDTLPPRWKKTFEAHDEIWVTARFLIPVYSQYFDINKIKVLPNGIDINIFNPNTTLKMSITGFGRDIMGREFLNITNDTFIFLSVFKWATRKGWDILFRAFIEEFSIDDNVALLIHSYYSDETKLFKSVESFVKEQFPGKKKNCHLLRLTQAP